MFDVIISGAGPAGAVAATVLARAGARVLVCDRAAFPRDKPTLQPVTKPTDQRFPHVTRGGAWDSDAAGCRSAARRPSTKDWIKLDPQRPPSIWWLTSAEFVGFRVVRAVEEQKELKGFRSKVTYESK